MGSVAGPLEMHHAVQAGEGCAVALVAVAIQLLFREDVPTVLFAAVRSQRPSTVQLQGLRGPIGAAEGGMAPRGNINTPRRRTTPWSRRVSLCKLAVNSWRGLSGR